MKIKMNSWHARLWRYLNHDRMPDSLCEYFWKWILGLMITIIILLCVVAVLVIFGLMLPALIGVWLSGYSKPQFAYEAGYTFYRLWLTGLGIYFILGVLSWALNRWFNTESYQIVSEFASAKKDKYCPKIEWIDE